VAYYSLEDDRACGFHFSEGGSMGTFPTHAYRHGREYTDLKALVKLGDSTTPQVIFKVLVVTFSMPLKTIIGWLVPTLEKHLIKE
jgi:hypothetical protein